MFASREDPQRRSLKRGASFYDRTHIPHRVKHPFKQRFQCLKTRKRKACVHAVLLSDGPDQAKKGFLSAAVKTLWCLFSPPCQSGERTPLKNDPWRSTCSSGSLRVKEKEKDARPLLLR